MSRCELRFAPSDASNTAFRILELPSELVKLVESANTNEISLCIKGASNEDAVLCTPDTTYNLRSVVLSNSVLVTTPSTGSHPALEIRDELHEILELTPCVPKLHRLKALLKGLDYGENAEDDDLYGEEEPRQDERKFTYNDARVQIQASEQELARGIADARVLVLKGCLRPMTPSYLSRVLELLLNQLVALSVPHSAAPIEDVLASLQDEHQIKREVAEQVMRWFGTIVAGEWSMEAEAVVKEVGLGVLRNHKHEAIAQGEFLARWTSAVGDMFGNFVNLSLLLGNYLLTDLPGTHPPVPGITYFPASELPVDPTSRFTDLFLTRPRWRADDITPFLKDIAINQKESDKLLLKYARASTDKDGVWYTARGR